jgi:hypothetical protein
MIQKFRAYTMHACRAAAVRLEGVGSAVDVTNAQDITIVAEINKGDATAIVLTPQRDDAAGTGFIALANNVKIFAAADVDTSDTLVRGADAVAYTSGAVNTTHRVVMRINPDSLGLHTGAGTNPITQIRVNITGGHADDRGSVTCYITPRYKP